MYTLEYLKKKINANKNIKLQDLKIVKRIIEENNNNDNILLFGEVWNTHDKHILFDGEPRTLKDCFRPFLVLDEEIPFLRFYNVNIAPGTSLVHKVTPTVLIAKVPPERLRKTTFFLIHHKQRLCVRLIKRKLTELSPNLKNKLKYILDNYNG